MQGFKTTMQCSAVNNFSLRWYLKLEHLTLLMPNRCPLLKEILLGGVLLMTYQNSFPLTLKTE